MARAAQGSLTPEVHTLTERVVQDPTIPGNSPLEKIHFVCQHVLKYTPDPIVGEMLVAPWVMARKIWDYRYESSGVQPMGDCDDKTCMEMSMLFNRRMICRAVGACQTEGYPKDQPKQINHVYPEVRFDQNVIGFVMPNLVNDGSVWIPLEPSSPSLTAGQQRPSIIPMARYYAQVDGQAIK